MSNLKDYIDTAGIKANKLYNSMGQSYRYHDIQDLSQELLIVAWLAIGTYNPDKDAGLKTWINRRMDYFIQDFVREEKNKKIHIDYVGSLSDLNEFIEKYHHASETLFDRELDLVKKTLSTKQQTILQFKIEGFTHEEIAAKMGYRDNSAIGHQWKKIVEEIIKLKSVKNILKKDPNKKNGSPLNKNEAHFNDFMKDFKKNSKKQDPQGTEA